MSETGKISPARKKKIKTVEKLTKKLQQAKSVVLTDYRGLTHQQLEKLRRSLKEAAAEFVIVKNTLLKKALETSSFVTDHASLEITGPTAILAAKKDKIAPLKILSQFMKESGIPAIKLAIVQDQILSAKEVTRLAKLPPREVLLAQLGGQINAPISRLHQALSWNLQKLVWVLQEVKRQK